MRPIIFPRAGRVAVVRYSPDGTLKVDETSMVAANGTVQSIMPTITFNTTELADGNTDWPLGVYDTGKAGQLQVTMSSFTPSFYAALIGETLDRNVTDTLWSVEESHIIESDSPYTIELDHEVAMNGTIVIVDETGSPFVSSVSSPGKGEYTVSGKTVTFNSADAGKLVVANYEWSSNDVSKFGLPESKVRPVLHVIMSGIVTSEDESQEYDFQLTIDKAKATGDIAPPEFQREPQNWQYTLQVLRPRPGRKALDFKFAPRN